MLPELESMHAFTTCEEPDHACITPMFQRQGEGGSYTWEHGWPRLMARRGDAGWRLTGRSVRVGHGRGRRRAATSGGMERPEEVSVMEAAPFVEDTLVLGRWLASRVVRGPDGGEV
jgi:hypothetical protein